MCCLLVVTGRHEHANGDYDDVGLSPGVTPPYLVLKSTELFQ
jgi:hypothetical protein